MRLASLESRVAAQRALRSDRWFADLAPTAGRDLETGLELEVDVTGWPTRVVRLDEASASLRDPVGLLGALRRCTGAAALAHLVQVAVRDESQEAERRARGEELLSGRRRVVAPPAYRAGPVVRPDGPLRPRSQHADERWERVVTGRSREGEVEVELGWVRGLRSVRTDPVFLRSTSPTMLRHALTEAFVSAQEGQHS